jgi:hypothetical protein
MADSAVSPLANIRLRKRLLARLTALPARRQRPEQSMNRRAKEAVGTHLATSVPDRTLRLRSLGRGLFRRASPCAK